MLALYTATFSWVRLAHRALPNGSPTYRETAMTPRTEKHISTTALARALGKESKELFILLTSGGWIVKVDNHWQLTEKGKFEGGIYVTHPKYGEYIAWPESIYQHPLFMLLPEAPLTATNLGHKLDLPARLINLLLAERGWIKKHIRGWLLTPAGKQLGGQQQESEQSGIPFVTWPESLIDNPALVQAVAQIHGDPTLGSLPTLDGRQINNNAERIITNWLYLAGVVHAQNYQLFLAGQIIEVNFYVPEINLCIDYWPANARAANLATQLDKQASYKYHNIQFIELHDEDFPQLDEILARKLLHYGLAVY